MFLDLTCGWKTRNFGNTILLFTIMILTWFWRARVGSFARRIVMIFYVVGRSSQLIDSSKRERKKRECFVMRPTKHFFFLFNCDGRLTTRRTIIRKSQTSPILTLLNTATWSDICIENLVVQGTPASKQIIMTKENLLFKFLTCDPHNAWKSNEHKFISVEKGMLSLHNDVRK